MTSAESDLFDLREEFVNNAVEDEFSNWLFRNEFLGPNLCGVQDVKVKFVFILPFDDLNGERPFGRTPVHDSLIEIFPMEI